MRNDFKGSSGRQSPNIIKYVEVVPLFENGQYGRGFFDKKCEFVEALVKSSGMLLKMDEALTDMKMKILLEGKAIHFEILTSPNAEKPVIESEFFITEMSDDIIQNLQEYSVADGHPTDQQKIDILGKMGKSVVDFLKEKELFVFSSEDIAADAFAHALSGWLDEEILDRPLSRQTWHLPRELFTDATIKPPTP